MPRVIATVITNPRFAWALTKATPGALKALEEAGQEPGFFLGKHICGDWGTCCPEDAQVNEAALLDGSRLVSAYLTLKGVKIWVITEAADDKGVRQLTTILLPEEY